MENHRNHRNKKKEKEDEQRRCLGKLAKILLVIFFVAYLSLGAYAFLLIESTGANQMKHHQATGGGVHHQHTPPTEEIRSDIGGGASEEQELSSTALLAEQEQMTRQVLDRLWDITENLNILYKENWTRLAAEEVNRLHESMRQQLIQAVAIGNRAKAGGNCSISKSSTQSMVHQQQQQQWSGPSSVKWNYPTAFLYALSVITTLGSCPVIPETTEGKCLTILYAGFGIPLLLFYLTVVGSSLSSCLCCWPMRQQMSRNKGTSSPSSSSRLEFIHQHQLVASDSHNKLRNPRYPAGGNGNGDLELCDDESIDMAEYCSRSPIRSYCPLVFCLLIVLIYMACGAWTFSSLMSLSLVDALLLSFMLFTTMGVPDPQSAIWTRTTTVVAVSIYIVVGITLCSLCFNLIYDWLLTRWIGQRHQQQQSQQPILASLAGGGVDGGQISIEMNHSSSGTIRR